MCFEHGWISLHQILAARPNGQMQSGYPFNRDYMYR